MNTKKCIYLFFMLLFIRIPVFSTISWMGNHFTGSQPEGSQTIYFYVEMYDSYSGCHAEVQINEGGTWVAYSLTQGDNNGNNSTWSANITVKSTATEYYFHGWDDWGADVWDSNSSNNYAISINPTTVSDGYWNSASTWCDGFVPTSATASYIIANNITLDANVTIYSLTINSGATFTASDASPRILTLNNSISGSNSTLSNSGTWDNGLGGNTVVFSGEPSSGDAIHVVSGTIAFENITVNKTAGSSNVGVSFGEGVSVTGTLEIGNGGFVSTAPPTNFYNSTAILKFNQGTEVTYDVNANDYSWSATEVPQNITVSSGTVNLNTNRAASGSLIVDGIISLAAGKQLTVAGVLTNNGTVTLQSDTINGTATLITPSAISGSGSYNVEQFLKKDRNYYIASPVSSASAAVVTDVVGNALYSRDEAGASWSTASEFINGIGYVASIGSSNGQVYTFTGTIFNKDTTVNLTRTTGQVKEGFNLVGNPYPAYLNWNTLTKSYLNNTMWYRTKEGSSYKFYTYNGSEAGYGGGEIGSPAGVTNFVPSMQAFWVRVENATTGSLGFKLTDRADRDIAANILKAPQVSLNKVVRIQVENQENTDETVLYFNDNADNDLDSYDSQKISNENDVIPEIYTKADNSELVINGMNQIPVDVEIPLGFRTGEQGDFTIKSTEFSNFATGLKLYLHDKLINDEMEISSGYFYTFISDIVDNTDRFGLIFRMTGTTTENEKVNNSFYTYVDKQNNIVVNVKTENRIVIYNAVGQKIMERDVVGKTVISDKLNTGVYFVGSLNSGNTKLQKIVIK
ncbi:MAG: hypothetical protein PHH37_13675 [Paludibacter sp.]|nr:hypothetical protein [Paludibacter sp.]